MGLEMKYFILKPRSKNHDDHYAHASREAMKAYAKAIESIDPGLAQDLTNWRIAELIRLNSIKQDEKNEKR